ncbi:hypothetical protein SmJEL517_g01898 [Synchytrium microbalum]|uniref:Enoyl-CoA hydratase n=1 Tax=Synchytrium microbalum TaxID=1806994 RepID=A0A507C498_9FUNG|nr:uncharacterized protein SmJEL517_g01898 [Synchytrium microbalum]TPX35797.1 hypothetical protein SmJEL517_g01898 [Synchytrium microbalum]
MSLQAHHATLPQHTSTQDYSKFKDIEVRIDGPVAIAYLNREKSLNGYTALMGIEIIQFFDKINIDDQIRVGVLTGKGRVFCAGYDFSAGGGDFSSFNTPKTAEESMLERDGSGLVNLINNRKVTIAALNGPAIGVGITMVLPLDMRIAAKETKVGFIFNRRGINAEAGSSYFLTRLVGQSAALGIVLRGDIRLASHNSLQPLFEELVDKNDQVLPKALEIAHEIARETSVVSNAVNKALLWHQKPTPQQQENLEAMALYHLGASADSKEGVKAFLEKRSPKWPNVISKDLPKML